MFLGLFRIWIVGTTVWVAYNVFSRWDQLFREAPHQWEEALNFGLNKNVYCELPALLSCEKVPWFSTGREFLLEQDSHLIAAFALYPLVFAVVLVVLGWILSGFRSK